MAAVGVAVEAPPANAGPRSPPRLKSDKGKLTEAHGEPPLIIKRNENGHLTRGRMLGEGGFARVYAATDSLNGATKAVKVISKEQLKSSKTKAKVGLLLCACTALADFPFPACSDSLPPASTALCRNQAASSHGPRQHHQVRVLFRRQCMRLHAARAVCERSRSFQLISHVPLC